MRPGALLLVFALSAACGPTVLRRAAHGSVIDVARDLRQRVRFVSISLDPERDTSERLRAYAKARGADLASWSFLTGPSAAVDAALEAFGVGKSSAQKDGEIDHLVVTFLIGPEGRIERRWVGLDHPAEEILADLERVATHLVWR